MKDAIVETYISQLKKLGIEYHILEHPQLISVAEVQKYLGYGMEDSAATLLMKADDRFIAIIRRGDTKLDSEKVKKNLGVKLLRMANEIEFAEIAGVPSGAASAYISGIPTFIDRKIFEKEYINAGSGSLLVTLRYKTEDLKKIPDAKIIDVTTIEQKKNGGAGKVSNKRLLSGITPSGDGSLHIGNYLGAVKQFIELARTNETYLMVADLHALTTVQDKTRLSGNIEALVLNELALLRGFLTEKEFAKIVFFRQSDVVEHTELQSILNNVTPLGLIKRAHAYKDKLAKDVMEDDINMGLFSYPMLMAADILIYKPDLVPVGKDQKQHVEITRDIAQRFNKIYGRSTKSTIGTKGTRGQGGIFKLPEAYIPEEVAVVLGTDGKRKMSKSLGNLISIFDDEEKIKKQVMSTYTDPTRIHATDPGHIEGNMVFTYLDFFGQETKNNELKEAYKKGQVADIEVKNYLYESLLKYFANARQTYKELAANPAAVKKILEDGAEKARAVAGATMGEVRSAVGLVNKYSIQIADNRKQTADNGKQITDNRDQVKQNTTGVITIEEFGRVELKVGKVIEATNKEGSEKLIRLVVDFGARGTKSTKGTIGTRSQDGEQNERRIIFTGVRGFGYTPDDFLNKQFFFITNLAPRKMMDEESQGMILAVDSDTEKKPLFVSAEGLPVGAKIR